MWRRSSTKRTLSKLVVAIAQGGRNVCPELRYRRQEGDREIPSDDGRLVTFNGVSLTCCVATSQCASFTPRCWWEMRDFVSCDFRFCWCVGSLQGLWYGWVNCTFQGRRRRSSNASPSKCRRSIASQVHGATFVLLCSALVLVTRAIALARRQLVKNCPSTQLMTHEARELSQSLVWSGLSWTATLQVAHPPLVQQVLHQHCEPLQSLCKLWRPPRETFHNVQRHTAITFRHVAASRSRFKPVAVVDPLSYAEGGRFHVRDSEPCTHNLTFTS